MASPAERFAPFAERMRAEGLPEAAIRNFEHYYGQLVSGVTGLMPEDSIVPVDTLPDAERLPPALAEEGRRALPRTVLLKLNGGLGTSMGLVGPKSLLVVRNGLTFLDIVLRQAKAQGIPLVLMDSFMTHEQTLAAIARHEMPSESVQAFEQHKVPKVGRDDLGPGRWSADARLEWCPPGHGNVYAALATSGTLEKLLRAGYEYAFVSNIDNLGAVIDPALLGHFVANDLGFMMEVADRTEADRKGGHLALRRDGQLVLRELAQTPAGDLGHFQNVGRHKYFNTNNLWLNLRVLRDFLAAGDGVVRLPMIRNVKTIDPRDAGSQAVYQLETAMAAAVELFEGAAAVRVPRARFAAVKNTSDLLGVRSDAYVLTSDFRVVPNPARTLGTPLVALGPKYFGFIDQLEDRVPYGPPSLLACERLEVVGDVRFGRDVIIRGRARIVNDTAAPVEIAAGTVVGD